MDPVTEPLGSRREGLQVSGVVRDGVIRVPPVRVAVVSLFDLRLERTRHQVRP